jgi:hypothetical protein
VAISVASFVQSANVSPFLLTSLSGDDGLTGSPSASRSGNATT